MLKKLVVHWLLAIVLVAIPMFTTSCSEKKGGEVMGPEISQVNTAVAPDGKQEPKAVVIASDRTKPGFAWAYGDWSSRVAWEARRALSQRADGTSAWSITNGYLGDWNYVASDGYARDQAMEEATDVGMLTDTSDGHHRGGWCTFFVRLVLYRASYWAGYGVHLTTPNFHQGVYSWCDPDHMTQRYWEVKPGWVLSAPNYHMGIFDRRANVGGKDGWWVIDSNWVGGNGNFWIGKHFMTDADLKAKNCWAWYPSWATTNG